MSQQACRFGAVLCSVASLLSLPSPSAAGDLAPAPEVVEWTGFYVGGQLGGAWSDADWTYANRNWFNTLGAELLGTAFGFDAGGVIGGGQLGYNYQTGAWVFGIEGSLSGADFDDGYSGPWWPTDRYATETGLLASVTGRVGYARDRWLLYGKAGWSGAEIDLSLRDTGNNVHARSEEWADGWTIGGGGEYAFGRFSLGVEYDYADLDLDRLKTRCNCPSGLGGGTPVVEADIVVQSITARLNYHLGR